MPDDLTDKRALVTGAAGGIGLAVAQRLAAGGARVAFVDQNEFDVKAAAAIVGPDVVGLPCDVRSNAEVAGAFAEAISTLGGLDVLVNNASIEIASPLLEMSESDIQHLFDVNGQPTIYYNYRSA